MKKSYLLLIISLFVSTLYGQNTQPPAVKSKTTFAIVVDNKSFDQAKEELNAYKNAIENDGLGVYLISHAWTSPEEIRSLLIQLYQDKKSPLEGAVFVGDIPIPMLRDAQHMTSAFKMDQKRNWRQSSVPSDRFYDDFGLKFDFIKQDSVKPLYFYYSLRADSRQHLHSTIYSARIKPLEKGKTDKYTQLKNYLRKVVALKTEEKNNRIDNLTSARGHGYNSESRVAWSGEQLTLREQFPGLFAPGSFVKFMDFDSYWPMKSYWLNEIQRPDLDVMLFHHHGSNDYQYINGYKEASDVHTSKENIKLYVRNKISDAVKKGKDKEETINYYINWLDIPRSWCEEAFDPKLMEKDSLANEKLDILVRDILGITPNARFVMFDACYNGSFYEDEYMAGAYIFNDGKTVVTQGNTVNAIQDKWPDEFLGLLDYGLRVGQWHKQVQFLETHIIGDPTFRFAKNNGLNFDINESLTIRSKDVSFWKKNLSHSSVDIQAMALRVLFDNDYKNISGLLKQTYYNSSSMIVRLEALLLLSQLNNDNFVDVLGSSISDSYELIRRYAAEYIAENGSDRLIPALATAILNDNASKRINFKITSGVKMVDLDQLETELKKQAESRPLYDREMLESMLKLIQSGKTSKQESLSIITSKTETVKNKTFEISRYRNMPALDGVDILLSIISDENYAPELRLLATESLGWFNYSCKRTYIVEKLNERIPVEKNDAISNEILKSANRLSLKK